MRTASHREPLQLRKSHSCALETGSDGGSITLLHTLPGFFRVPRRVPGWSHHPSTYWDTNEMGAHRNQDMPPLGSRGHEQEANAAA